MTDLATKIAKYEVDLSRYRSDSRRIRGAVTLYGVLAFVAYTAVWALFFARDRSDGRLWLERAVPVVAIPVVVQLVRSALDLFWGRRIDGAESALQSLKVQQRDKVEQFKDKTDFYTTKSLIERYESTQSTPGAKSVGEKPGTESAGSKRGTPSRAQVTPQVTPQGTPQRRVNDRSLEGTTPTPQHLSGVVPRVTVPHPIEQPPPPQRIWVDRVLDVIVGEDESQPSSRFQLERKIRERDEQIHKMELELIRLRSAIPSKSGAPQSDAGGGTQHEAQSGQDDDERDDHKPVK